MRYNYYYCKPFTKELVDYLERTGIPYKIFENTKVKFLIFNLWSTTPGIETHLLELQKITRPPIIYAEYTEAERDAAKLLVVRATRQSIDILNEDAYQYSCEWKNEFGTLVRMHETQIGLLSIRKEPSAKTQAAFWAESTGFSVIFADVRIRNLAEEEHLRGVEFKEVLLKNGKKSTHIFQMTSQKMIGADAIKLGFGEKVLFCRNCGKARYALPNTYQLHLDFSQIKEYSDFYITDQIFGEGPPQSLYIMSQRFYKILKKNKLAGKLDFIPVAEA